MKLPAPSEGTFERCPPGNHLAVCYEVIDLGTVTMEWEGETKHQRKIWIGWETPHETLDDGRPYVIGKRYTLSSHERSSLRKDLESWRGCAFKDEDFGPQGKFDIKNVIGVGCFLNVVHVQKGDKTYANIASIAALPKGTETPALCNEPLFLSLAPNEYDHDSFTRLSERMQAVVSQSPEWQQVAQLETASAPGPITIPPKVGSEETEDDSPF